jgi:hypothetical protein
MGFNRDTWGGSWKRGVISSWANSWGIITAIIPAVLAVRRKHRGFLKNVGKLMK